MNNYDIHEDTIKYVEKVLYDVDFKYITLLL